MPSDRGFIFVDGSHLFASINEIWRTKPEYKDKKVNIGKLSDVLMSIWHGYLGGVIRIKYYFKKSDSRLKVMLTIPDPTQPRNQNHWQIEECGESVDAIPAIEVEKLSPKYRDSFARGEKGLDIKLACDALSLVLLERADNVVLLVNDRDFVPLIREIQHAGANVYLTALDRSQPIREELAKLSDMYISAEADFSRFFEQ